MAEKRTIELEVNSNLGNLKQQLKAAQVEVQTLSEKFGATSAEAIQAAKAAAILKDKIGDAKVSDFILYRRDKLIQTQNSKR